MRRASPPMVLSQPNGFDPLALLLADLVPRMVGGAAVDGGVWMVVKIRAKMAQRKKLAWPLRSSQLLLAVERLVANDGWVGGKPCQGRQPPEAGAAGPPLQGLPPSHTRPPRSTADPRDAASSAIYARIHAAGNTERWRVAFLRDMRRQVERAHVGDEVGRIEGLVAATVMHCAPGE